LCNNAGYYLEGLLSYAKYSKLTITTIIGGIGRWYLNNLQAEQNKATQRQEITRQAITAEKDNNKASIHRCSY